MDTPEALQARAVAPLYGDGGDSINRRALIGAVAAVVLASPGLAAPTRIRSLWWRGHARAEVGGRSLDLVAETSLTLPLLQVRSTSRIASEGPQKSRTLILEPEGAWVERDGSRSPLPPQIGIHERQQYTIYAWLLMVQQRKRPRPGRLPLRALPFPDIVFDIGRDGYPLSADLTVEAPEYGKPPIAERVAFSGRIDSNGVRWPRRFDLAQDGKPYFTLHIDAFRAR